MSVNLQKFNDDILEKKRQERIGVEKKYNNQGSLMRIVEYYGCHDVLVEFQDEWKYKTHVQMTQFNDGRVKNPYFPTVFNVGVIGELNHIIGKKPSNEFHNLLQFL